MKMRNILAVGIALLIAACGGGGGGGGGGTPTPAPTPTPTPTPTLTAPAITTQPQAQSVLVGATAVFSVTATGTAPLTYQWRKNGTAVSGGASATYSAPPTVLTDSGAQFDVVVSNSAGSVTSATAALTAKVNQGNLVSRAPGSSFGTAGIGPQSVETVGTASVELAGNTGPVPTSYDGTIALQGFTHGDFTGTDPTLSLPSTSISLINRITSTLAGRPVHHYSGGVLIPGVTVKRLAATALASTQSGLSEVLIGVWKHAGVQQTGFFEGLRVARGSFALGTPTPGTALASIPSATFSGYTYAAIETPGITLSDYKEIAGQASATYDAATRQLTLTLSNLAHYNGDIDINSQPTSTWPTANGVHVIGITGATFTCTAQGAAAANLFTCTMTNSEGATGSFVGGFYGPTGTAIGGSFALTGVIAGLTNAGLAGAVALSR